jgi:hypothetical protein
MANPDSCKAKLQDPGLGLSVPEISLTNSIISDTVQVPFDYCQLI